MSETSRLLDYKELYGVARWLVEEVGMNDTVPVDIEALCYSWQIRLVPVASRAKTSTDGQQIFYDSRLPAWRRRSDIAHELAHLAISWNGLPDDEESVGHVAAAILCPDRPFKRDLAASRWDLAKLQPIYGCSWELTARRVVDVVPSIVTIIDNGRQTRREQSRWLNTFFGHRMTPLERSIATLAAQSGEHVYAENLITAYALPNPEGTWMRVIVLCGAEELEAYLASRNHPRSEPPQSHSGG
ncbi:MAG: ImmA/IrrE family metallo-endopeptidase [Myxococcales bacterium]|nr:ImmA/IrrE family metallo-endopeptidase [Myxococcales bacterium]